jgi:uncharacterized membrane protein
VQAERPTPALTVAIRALALLGLIGLSLGLMAGAVAHDAALRAYLTTNQMVRAERNGLLATMMGAAAAAVVIAGAWLAVKRSPARLLHFACRLAPAACIGFLPMLFRWKTWADRPLPFLALTSLFCLASWVSMHTSMEAGPLAAEGPLRAWAGARLETLRARHPRVVQHLPLAIVSAAALGYTIYFSYYTIAYHQSVRSGYDLGIKNNIFWNTLHGMPFKASPTLGPSGTSHFGRHADLLVYLLLPLYAWAQRPETVLVFQSLFAGMAAVPLYLLARRHAGEVAAVVIAWVYLLHPALHGANLFEFHFIPFGLPLLWIGWLLLEQRRDLAGFLFLILTLFTREDVALWVVVLGMYLVASGERPRAGLVAGVAGSIYFVLIKFVVMPSLSGDESFSGIYDGLIISGEQGFGSVLKTLIGNPAYTLSTMLTEAKLVYVLQMFLPLAFLPLRRPIWMVLAIPGFLLTVLSPSYGAVFNIHFQYGPHWLAFMLPAIALGIEYGRQRAREPRRATAAALVALVCAAVPVSYQFGGLMQHHTSYGGPIAYTFGMDEAGRQRYESMQQLMPLVPPDAKVAASAFATPQFSSREDDYDMNISLFDADYVVFPTELRELINHEKDDIRRILSNGSFGVVKIAPAFALAKRGHPTELNAQLLARLK